MASNNGSIDEIIGQKGFDDVEQITQKMNTLYVAFKQNVTAINLMNDALSKATTVKDVTGGIDNITTKTKKANQVVTEFIETQSHLDKAVTLSNHALNDQELAYAKLTATMGNGNKAAKLVTETTVKQNKDTNDLKTAYQRLNDEYKASLIHSKNLAVQYGVTSKEFKAAAAQTNLMGAELKSIDAQLGIHSKNVGNYADGVKKGTSGIATGVGKIWSGLRTVANILPGIGLAGMFGLAFEALTPLVEKMDLFSNKMKDLRSAIASGISSTTEEVNNLKRLYDITQDSSIAIERRKNAVDKLQELYPAYFKNIKDETFLNGGAKKSYDELKDSILETAKTKAVEGKIAEIINKGLEDELELTERIKKAKALAFLNKGKVSATDPMGKADVVVTTNDATRKQAVNDAEVDLAVFKEAQNKKLKVYQDYLNQKSGLETLKKPEDEKKDKKVKEVNRIDDLKKEFEAEKLVIETENEKGFTTELEYRNKLLALIKEYVTAKENALGELSKHEKESQTTWNLSLLRETKSNTSAIEKYYADQLKMMESYDAEVKKNDDIKVKDKQTVADKYAAIDDALWAAQFAGTQKQLEEAKKADEEYKKRRQARYEWEVFLMHTAFDIANQISDNIYAKELQQIEDKSKALDESHNKEIKQIEQSGLTTIQQTKAKAKADAQYEAEKKKIDKDRKKALHEQAVANKALSLSEIALTTILAVMHALDDKTVPYPVRVGYAISAGAIGAINLIKASLVPLPKYAKGRGKGKDEMAIVGEAGTEAIVRGDGRVEITPNRATTTFLKADDQVISNSELMRSIQNSAYVKLGNQSNITTDKLQMALIDSFNRQDKKTDELIKVVREKNLSVNTTNYGGFDSYLKAHIR